LQYLKSSNFEVGNGIVNVIPILSIDIVIEQYVSTI
jgi:hypothetical protein